MTAPFPPDHPFTAAQAFAQGVTRSRLRASIGSGAVRELLYGVYVPGWWKDTADNRARAAAYVLPDHAVIADRSAASLHGVDAWNYAELDVIPDLEVVSIDEAGPTRRIGVLGGKRNLIASDIMTLDGIPVTTPLRTACDVACLRGRHRAIGVLDAFRAKHGITEAEMVAILPRFAGRRGVVQLRELVGLSRDGVDSPPESWLRLDLHDAGFPMPETQVEAVFPGWGPARMENAYRRLKVAVEFDGEEDHTEEEDVRRDQARRAAGERDGWAFVVVRRDGLSLAGREKWLAEFREIYDRRARAAGKRIYSRAPNQGRPRRRRRRR